MKILIIPSWYPSEMDPNGVPFIRAQAQALARAGHSVTVVFTQAYSLKTVVKQKRLMFGRRENSVQGVREILTYFPKTHLKRFDELTRLVQGKRVLKKLARDGFSPDIVHVHTYLAGDLGVWYSNKYSVPLVVTEHYTGFARGIVKPWELKLARNLYYNSQENFAVSGAFASTLKKETGADFSTLPNMVNTDRFSISKEKKDRGFTYLFVGSLHSKKNPHMLLDSFVNLYREDNSIRLIMAGEGEEYNSLKKKVIENHLENAVEFPGFINGDRVAQLMKEADTFILPSKFETFGIVVIEAMASGLPVIVTRSGGPESFVVDRKHGLVIDQEQGQLEKAMKSVRDINWDSNEIRDYVYSNFSEDAVIKRLETRYRDILNQPQILQASRELNVSGGISKVALQLGRELTNLGGRVTTITTEVDDVAKEYNPGRVMLIPTPKWISKLPGYLNNYFKTRFFANYVDRLYKKKNRDRNVVTISHRDSFGANIAIGHSCHREAVEIKKREGRALWWLNPIHPFYLKEERRIFSKPYPQLGAISRAIGNEYKKHYNVPDENIHIIPNGVDIERFNPDSKSENRGRIIEEFGLDSDSRLLLFVGNEFKRKGLDFIIDSLRYLNDNTHLFVLGGADKTPYLKVINDLGLEERVHFTGRREDAPYFFSGCDLFILPANYEPFGLVGIEALSSGTPILAPKLGGFLDYLVDGENGLFIERDGKDIAEKVNMIFKDENMLKEMSIKGRDKALEYSWEKISIKYFDLINKVGKSFE